MQLSALKQKCAQILSSSHNLSKKVPAFTDYHLKTKIMSHKSERGRLGMSRRTPFINTVCNAAAPDDTWLIHLVVFEKKHCLKYMVPMSNSPQLPKGTNKGRIHVQQNLKRSQPMTEKLHITRELPGQFSPK